MKYEGSFPPPGFPPHFILHTSYFPLPLPMTLPEALALALRRHQAGQLADAEALYRQILAAQPNHSDALHLLGVIAHQCDRHESAIDLIRQSILHDPRNAAAHSNLGEACRKIGRIDEAIASFRRALELQPHFPAALNNLAVALREHGQLDEAIAACRQAINLEPGYSEAYSNLGNAQRDRGQLHEAIAAYRRALELKPDFAETHGNLSVALREHGHLEEALAAVRRAIELKPDFPEAHNNLGAALRERGQFREAIAAYRHAIELNPSHPDPYTNLGIALAEEGQLDEALAASHHALILKPDFPEAHSNLGNLLRQRGQLEEAVAAYRRALALAPLRPSTHSNLIYALHFHPGHDAASISAERRRWDRQFAEPLKQSIPAHANDPAVAGKLRIGYVSPDFRDHVVGRNLMPLFRCHDHRHFEIVCYSGVVRPDHLTEAFRQRTHQWRSTVGVADHTLADMIRKDEVDILIDLSQHMSGNRLPVFARQPAPVQASFAGYPESAGLKAIGHRISDRYLELPSPPITAASGEHVHLLDSFWCYDPCGDDAVVKRLPAGEAGPITFGCLNSFCKINERALSLWAAVLRKLPDSRLILMSQMGSHRRQLLEALAPQGVEARRVEFVEPRPRRRYLELYHSLDIVLDTFPYNGHTTSLDALWMGVPVVTLAGETPVSRAGLSQLSNLGLPELVAHSEAEYVAIAEALAQDLSRLALLRSTLRDRMQNSILMDAPRFARQVEVAYQKMWQHWRPSGSDLCKD